MNLKSLLVDTKSAWVEFPGLDGFSVEIVNLGREKLVALRKRCMITKFDRRTKQPTEELDDKKFIAEYSEAVITNWKGLKMSYLEQLGLFDVSSQDPESEVEYSKENAEVILGNSGDFDSWLNGAVFDLDNFRTTRA